MKVKGFNGRLYTIGFKKSASKESKGHTETRKILEELFPLDIILEELELPGTKEKSARNLYADFFIPRVKLLIEVHGKQHYEYTPFFHNDKQGFVESLKRDRRKKDWCELNDITYVELSCKENYDNWKQRIICAAENR